MPYKDKDKQNAYMRDWMKKRREAWIDSQRRKCAICGRADLPFEVDHVDRSTKVSHRVWSWSDARRQLELDKCQLLCQECHYSKTSVEVHDWKGTAEHGTHSMYTQGCKCESCKEAHAEAARISRAAGKKW